MELGNAIKNLRKDKGVNQEALAEQFNVSVQAVSKWECGLSYPDIVLLPAIAQYFGVSLDYLFTGEGRQHMDSPHISAPLHINWPDDNDLRVVQFIGHKMVTQDRLDTNRRLPLAIPDNASNFSVHIHGSADIQGGVGGDAHANGNINCGGGVGGDAHANGNINCGGVGGDAHTNGGINCGDVGGDVTTRDGDVHCKIVHGDVTCEGAGSIYYET